MRRTGTNGERMVFLYRQSRVTFGGIAGELTLQSGREILDARGIELQSPDPLELRLVDARGQPHRRDLRLPPQTKTRARDGATQDGLLETAGQTYLELPAAADGSAGAALMLPPGTRLRLPAGTVVRRTGKTGLRLVRSHRYPMPPGQALVLPQPLRASGRLQFARTPYLVTFRAGDLDLMLCTVHIYYGETSAKSAGMGRRIAEIDAVTRLLAERARRTHHGAQQLLLLGDFNIVGKRHDTMAALERHGFTIPAAIQKIPAGTNVQRTKFYDQIAYHRAGRPDPAAAGQSPPIEPRLEPIAAGVFDYFDHIYRDRKRHPKAHDERSLGARMRGQQRNVGAKRAWKYETWRTYQISDHLPMWIELRSDFGEEVLRGVVGG